MILIPLGNVTKIGTGNWTIEIVPVTKSIFGFDPETELVGDKMAEVTLADVLNAIGAVARDVAAMKVDIAELKGGAVVVTPPDPIGEVNWKKIFEMQPTGKPLNLPEFIPQDMCAQAYLYGACTPGFVNGKLALPYVQAFVRACKTDTGLLELEITSVIAQALYAYRGTIRSLASGEKPAQKLESIALNNDVTVDQLTRYQHAEFLQKMVKCNMTPEAGYYLFLVGQVSYFDPYPVLSSGDGSTSYLHNWKDATLETIWNLEHQSGGGGTPSGNPDNL